MDGGITWSEKPIGQTNYWLTDLCFKNPDTGFTVGYYGVILKTVNSGGIITEIKPVAASPMSKFVVYPNPANTKIFISCKRKSMGETFLSIFSVSGKQMLYNNFGNEEIMEQDITALLKGLYLIKIQTKDVLEYKKLVID